MKSFKLNELPKAIETTSRDSLPRLIIEGQSGYSVKLTFDCGQCFRFERFEGSEFEYEVHGIVSGKYIRVANSKDGSLVITNATMQDYNSFLGEFLGLNYDWDSICGDILARCPSSDGLHRAAEVAKGIRILKQESWETVASFIISQNNNIPRIKKTIETLCRLYGNKIEVCGNEYYTFPSPSAVKNAGIEGLAPLRAGYRDEYLVRCAEEFEKGYTLPNTEDPNECIKEICKLHGVGPKVASCIALFTLNRLDAFPIDVWMKRAMKLYFPESYDPRELGPYAGVAQQYLFYYERTINTKGH